MSRGWPYFWLNNKKSGVRLISAIAMLVLIGIAVIVWQRWFAPTSIVLVNYPEFQSARLIRAKPDRFFQIDVLSRDQLQRITKSADLVMIFGRGLKLDDVQRGYLQKLGAGKTAIYVDLPNDPALEIGNLPQADRATMAAYLKNGGQENYSRLLEYARWAFDGRKWNAHRPPPANVRPAEVFFYSADDPVFTDFASFVDWRSGLRKWKSDAPVLALLTSVPDPFKFETTHVDDIINSFEQKGFNVVPIAAKAQRLPFLQQVKPDGLVYLPHGRVTSDDADELQQWLVQHNIPLFAPLTMFDEHQAWQNSKQGLSGGLLTMSVVLPELDGAAVPMVIAAQEREANGIKVFRAIPDRLNQFVERVTRAVRLRKMANRDKKLAIYYYKGPGQSALVAGDLEVVPSLYALLAHLREQGYRIDGLPGTVEEFATLLQHQGANIGPYARGDFARFLRDADPAFVSVSQLKQWCGTTLLQSLCDQTAARYGAAPGDYLSAKDKVAVARVELGNIVLLPQPLPGVGEDTFHLVHGAKTAPPWPYLASYLWTRNVFQADAIMHFGTHGSLEFTPEKQVALSAQDWPDALIGPVPHTYLYTMSNVGEAIIAKRRSYATIVSHLTPPFQSGGAQADFSRLAAALQAWKQASNAVLRNEYASDIQQDAIRLKLHEDLAFETQGRWDESQLNKLADHMESLTSTRVTEGLYTLGRSYSREQLERTIALMTSDSLAADTNDIPSGSSGADTTAKVDKTGLYQQQLEQSPTAELEALTNHLGGGFIPPSSGGDMLQNPDALPTGRNLFSIDAEKAPSPQAWRTAGGLVTRMLAEQRQERQGAWPKKVAFTLWAGDFIHTDGLAIAQILQLLGIQPVWDQSGRIMQLKLIPRDRMEHPRIDVVIQTSGQLRDLASSRLKLIQQAVAMAMAADEPDNAVAAGSRHMQRVLKEQGLAPADATRYAAQRIFGGINGNYGSGIMHLVEAGDHWQSENDIARNYLNNMGALYADSAHWGEFAPGVFQTALADTDVVVQPLSSNTWGPLSLDHVYEFMGGLNLAVRHVNGRDAAGYFTDTRHAGQAQMLGERAGLAIDARTTLLNPDYIRGLTGGGASSAEVFAETFRNTHAWTVMKPAVIGKNLWDDLFDTYVQDNQHLGLHDFFQKQNPFALQEMSAVMLETARKGYWKPAAGTLREVAALHAQLVGRYGASGTEYVNHNSELRKYISQQLDEPTLTSYNNALQKSNEGHVIDGRNALVLTQLDVTDHGHTHDHQHGLSKEKAGQSVQVAANESKTTTNAESERQREGALHSLGRVFSDGVIIALAITVVLAASIALVMILRRRYRQRKGL